MNMEDTIKLGYEDAIAKLESILEQLAGENTTLDTSIALYAEAAELIKHCNDKLNAAQVRIREIDEVLNEIEAEDGV